MTKRGLPVISGIDTIKALTKAGYFTVRQKGSHVRMKKITQEGAVFVTVPLHKVLDRGTLRGIIKDTKLTVEEFLELL
ncbi:MAG: type II toxin-antitoxin system HicA family toxin [Candidatus Hydrothermarchaeales archaeon]